VYEQFEHVEIIFDLKEKLEYDIHKIWKPLIIKIILTNQQYKIQI